MKGDLAAEVTRLRARETELEDLLATATRALALATVELNRLQQSLIRYEKVSGETLLRSHTANPH